MIDPIAPIAPPAPPVPGAINPPGPLELRAAQNGDRRFIVQFAADTPLPPQDEIPCTASGLTGIIPDDVQRSLTFSDQTAWLCRLYPAPIASGLDADAAAYDSDLVGFSRYYRLRFTGGMEDSYIIDVLSRAGTISAVQPEFEFELLDLVKHADPNFGDQDYLKAAPLGISVDAAWSEGAGGSGIAIGFAEPGIKPTGHADIEIDQVLAEGAFSDHMLNVAGILAAKDNDKGIVGVSPYSRLVFSATDAKSPANVSVPSTQLKSKDEYLALARLNGPNVLKAGDVVNFSIAVLIELDQAKSPNVGPTLPRTVQGKRGGRLNIAMKAGSQTLLDRVEATIPLEFDSAFMALLRLLKSKGITVCMGAGNGYVATYLAGTTKVPRQQTGMGADLSMQWVGQSSSMDRSSNDFRDGGGIIVGGAFFSPGKSAQLRNNNFNHGNRVDCFAQASNVATWDATSVVRIAGTSAATPIVAGAAALVQSYLKANYGVTLTPGFLRALFSDPAIGTPAQVGDQIGVMPDLAKIIPLLKLKTLRFDKDKLLAQLQDHMAQSKAAIAAARTAAGPATFIHDPYSVWNEKKKAWEDLGLTDGVFNEPLQTPSSVPQGSALA
jgi:hypothetical protein